jgi:hypothetical protein
MTSAQAYTILGLAANADLEKIRKAYRLKAKESHPDVNNNPNAQQQFIEINEAYEFLVKEKTGKIYSDQSQKFQSAEKKKKSKTRTLEWTEAEKKKARERAFQYSQMPYDGDFESIIYNRGLFRIGELFPKTVWALCISLALFILIGIPIILFESIGVYGLFGALLMLFVTSPFLVSVVRAMRD